MKTKFKNSVTLCLLIFFISSCYDTTHRKKNPAVSDGYIAKGDRILGMDLLDTTPSLDFFAGAAKVIAAGVQFITFPVLWNQVNATGTSYDTAWVQNIKDMAAVCTANSLKLSLTFWTVDVTGKHVPADLMATRFDDVPHAMAARFVALLDKLFITENIDYTLLTSVQIGNEIDGYNAGGDVNFSWSDYGAFLYNIKLMISSKSYSSLKIGFTGTLYGLNSQKAIFTAVAGAVDIIGVTYYPINPDFTVKDPSLVSPDISALVSNYSTTTRPIYFQEVGYQSGPLCSSTDENQAQFVRNIFTSWDTHRDFIKAVSFLRLNDVTAASASGTAALYGLGGNTVFIEYIRTLGLVNYDGTVKPAFSALSENARSRGW